MKYRTLNILVMLILIVCPSLFSQNILVYMDLQQKNHIKAYGIAFWVLERGVNVEWLLNYRGGSFLMAGSELLERELLIRGVGYSKISNLESQQIHQFIENENMDVVLLEKAPTISIYAPPNKEAWDDAVILALDYAEIPYKTIWDEEVLNGELLEFDWLHLHHDDFSGQYGKFFANYRNADWYIDQVKKNQDEAKKLGFSKVSTLKKSVTLAIRDFVASGGFLFAMCSATDTFDISLAAMNTDICAEMFDGDPVDPKAQEKLDFSQTLAFENFELVMDPLVYEYSNIDIPASYSAPLLGPQAEYFKLFEFSAKYDPVPTMLTQNHVAAINGFMGQTTGYRKNLLKKSIVVMAEAEGTDQVKYLHGNFGKGTFTFFGGHDPEDYQHYVNDPPTELERFKNSPGYRLILNNILFPAARKKKLKT